MTKINGIHFSDEWYTLKEVQDILKEKKKEIKFTLIVPTIKPTKRRLIKLANSKKKKYTDWRYKYPECPDCKAIGINGLTTTRLGSLRCRNCNSMFKKKQDRFYNIKVGKSMGD